jgi:hypothetical protein
MKCAMLLKRTRSPVNGIPMSNFVHPSYFEPFKHPAGTQFDHLGKLKAPFTLDAGGYSIVQEDGKIKNIFGSKAKEAASLEENRAMHRSEYRSQQEDEAMNLAQITGLIRAVLTASRAVWSRRGSLLQTH